MNKELAKRAVACKHWRWMPGMLTLEEVVPPAITMGWDAARVLHADEGDAVQVCTVLGKVRDIHDTALPDLTDPATLGCLLALVREAWGDETIHTEATPTLPYGQRGFVIGAWDPESPADGIGPNYTEAEVLVAALEAAPCPQEE